jgi:hypothetical protein
MLRTSCKYDFDRAVVSTANVGTGLQMLIAACVDVPGETIRYGCVEYLAMAFWHNSYCTSRMLQT